MAFQSFKPRQSIYHLNPTHCITKDIEFEPYEVQQLMLLWNYMTKCMSLSTDITITDITNSVLLLVIGCFLGQSHLGSLNKSGYWLSLLVYKLFGLVTSLTFPTKMGNQINVVCDNVCGPYRGGDEKLVNYFTWPYNTIYMHVSYSI